MDDDDEFEDEGPTSLPSQPWSWPWFFESFFKMLGFTVTNVGAFLDDGIAVLFAHMHNRKVDRDGQKALATDVLADLGQLPTKE